MSEPGGSGRDGFRGLDRLQPGESGIVVLVGGDTETARRLMELGLVPGTVVEVVRRAPLGDPVEIRLREVHLSIRLAEAARVHVARR